MAVKTIAAETSAKKGKSAAASKIYFAITSLVAHLVTPPLRIGWRA